jgi:hypothetical protein
MIAQTQNQESTLQTMLKSIAMAMVATVSGPAIDIGVFVFIHAH